jgi:DMSO/TMAO reductase YedYZ heme-binding membrane subunit
VPTTAGRSRRRQGVHAGAQGAAGEHSPKIMGVLSASIVVVILVLAFTKTGRDIDAATQRFMLFYAGVFALIGLTGSVLLGLVATDRVVMTPGRRVMAQAVHRAFSLGTLAFLIIHIVTEILAQRSHVIDGAVPFLSPFRTFYIGLGTIASDLIVLLVVTSIIRKRFTAQGKAWRWRAIHYTSYVAFVFGVLHGLLGGRTAKPYVDWSYGFAIAVTALGLVVRFLVTSLRPKETLSAPPGADRPAASGTSPMRAAALGLAQAQLAGTIQVLPAAIGARTSVGMPGTDSWTALPAARGWSPATSTGPFPALSAPVPAASGPSPTVPGPSPTVPGSFQAIGDPPAYAAEPSSGAYRDLGFTPLGAPPYGDEARQPRYEPGYDGPPRFEGAPRRHVPQDESSSRPYGSAGSRSGIPGAGPATGPMPRLGPGPAPRAGTGPARRADSGPMPRLGPGPVPRADTGPIPRAGTGPMPRTATGPMPRMGPGPAPRAGTGPMPRIGNGQPMPRAGTGPMPHRGTSPMPRADTGPMPRAGTGPMPRADTGPLPRAGAGAGPTAVPKLPADSPQAPRTGRGRRGTGRPSRGAGGAGGAGPADARRREGPGPHRGDE